MNHIIATSKATFGATRRPLGSYWRPSLWPYGTMILTLLTCLCLTSNVRASSPDEPTSDRVPITAIGAGAQPPEIDESSVPEARTVAVYQDLKRRIDLGEIDPVKVELEKRITNIEQQTHRFDPSLLAPITLLGDIKLIEKDYGGALDLYGRAVHLSRVSSGLHSADQVPVVYREATTYLAVGDLAQANQREEYAWQVLQRTHGPFSPKLLPGIERLANWYRRTHNTFGSRSLFKRAVHIIEANYDDSHPGLIGALTGLAQSYRNERFPPLFARQPATTANTPIPTRSQLQQEGQAPIVNRFPEGESALKRIVEIRRAAVDKIRTADPIDKQALFEAETQLGDAIVELGDWNLLFEKTRASMQFYRLAQELGPQLEAPLATPDNADVAPTAALDAGDSANNTNSQAPQAPVAATPTTVPAVDFSQPELLYFPAPTDPEPPTPPQTGERQEGFVEVSYTITQRGTVTNLKTLASQPPGLMDFRVRKSLRASRYRPVIVDGRAVPKRAHSYRHNFAYYTRGSGAPATDAPQATDEQALPIDSGPETQLGNPNAAAPEENKADSSTSELNPGSLE